MKIIQVAHALHPTDAASRQLLNMDKLLRELGHYWYAIFPPIRKIS